MITRDNKASLSGTAQSARQRLGEIIAFYRKDRDWSLRDVSRRAKVSQNLVEDWESGKAIPSRDEWKALCQGVNRALQAHHDVYERARNEAETEARERAAKNEPPKEQPKPMRPDTKINTTLADKLANVTVDEPKPVAPPLRVVTELHPPPATKKPAPTASEQMGLPVRGFAADGRKLAPTRPQGAGSAENVERRKAFVRQLLIANPNKRTQGADSVLEHVRRQFGIGISPDTVDEIREELRRERIKAEIIAELPAPVPPTMPAMAAQLLEHIATPTAPAVPATNDPQPGDLEAAVQLIRDALPGLQTFTISIDENGEASVDWQIRKVKIETVGGSIKVRK